MENVLISEHDKHLLEKYAWFIGSDGYVRRTTSRTLGKQRTILLHREIMLPVYPLVVDHMNGNKLDNRRVNLRIVTRGENNRNKKKSNGYYFHKFSGKFAASFCNKHLGLFENEVEAKQAYLKAQAINLNMERAI